MDPTRYLAANMAIFPSAFARALLAALVARRIQTAHRVELLGVDEDGAPIWRCTRCDRWWGQMPVLSAN